MTILKDLYVLVATVCVLAMSCAAIHERSKAIEAEGIARYMRAETESVYRTVGKHASSAYRCVDR